MNIITKTLNTVNRQVNSLVGSTPAKRKNKTTKVKKRSFRR